jgi:hypothetical protein
LTADDVIWTAFRDHRQYRGFEEISMFSGYIRWDKIIVPYLPERVLRQFGYVQDIPRSPQLITAVRLSVAEVDARWLGYSDYVVHTFNRVRQATFPSECTDKYFEWYRTISHPYIIPPVMKGNRPSTKSIENKTKSMSQVPSSVGKQCRN